VQVSILKLENDNYRALFKFPPIEWCPLMSNSAKKSNPLIKTLMTIMRKTAKEFVHPCPFIAVHTAHNITLDRSLALIYPKGTYRFILRVSDDVDKNIWTIKLVIQSLND